MEKEHFPRIELDQFNPIDYENDDLANIMDLCQWVPHTFEGEGPHMGNPVSLLRFSRCNLDCRWKIPTSDGRIIEQVCDTDDMMKAGPKGMGIHVTYKDIREAVTNTGKLMITGGEPLTVHRNRSMAIKIIEALSNAGIEFDVVFETNGFKVDEMLLEDLRNTIDFCIPEGTGKLEIVWGVKFLDHYTQQYMEESVEAFLDLLATLHIEYWDTHQFDYCIKPLAPFNSVATSIFDWIVETKGPFVRKRIWIMPLGDNSETLKASMFEAMKLANKYRCNISTRMHIVHGFP